MKKCRLTTTVTSIVLFTLIPCATFARVYYVDLNVSGTGDGLSWVNAFKHPQDALDIAILDDQVWVAQGTYKRRTPADTVVLNMVDGVAVYCGFIVENCTFDENRAGDSGGGMYNQVGSPTVTNSTFTYNRAQGDGWGAGGGMYNASSSPIVDNCTFYINIAEHDGGGMYNWNSNATVTDCIFDNNISNAGGAIHNEDACPTISNCTFTANGVSQGTQIICDPFDCYPSPYGGHGGAIYNNAASPTITDCFLNTNFAAYFGGGMYNQGESLFVTNCTFTENSAMYGGGMYSSNSAPSVTTCSFIENSAGQGGGMFIDGAVSGLITPSVSNCTFAENRADGSGGAMTIENSRPTIVDCIFSKNSAISKGGGIHNYITTSAVYVPSITNCIFSGNSSSYGGGAYTSEHCPQITMNLNVTNWTFTGNRAVQQGGGICNGECGSSTIVNSISWGNSAPDSPEIYGFATVTYSDVQGVYMGDGNMDVNPLFVDAGQWHDNETPGDPSDDYWIEGNYHLQPTSPCIDKGNNGAPKLPDTDFEGDPRVMDGDNDGFARVDMGADEFGDFCEGDFEPDGDVDGSDLAVFAADFGRTDCGAAPPCEGDFDGDLDVDGSDLAVFAADFGRTDCPTIE